MKAVFKSAKPYADDALNLPVKDLELAIPYYEHTLGFRVIARHTSPHPRAVLARDSVEIGLAENGGDPTQEGCFFEVDNVDAANAEINGSTAHPDAIKLHQFHDRRYRAFFVVAPDGLCYMIAQFAG